MIASNLRKSFSPAIHVRAAITHIYNKSLRPNNQGCRQCRSHICALLLIALPDSHICLLDTMRQDFAEQRAVELTTRYDVLQHRLRHCLYRYPASLLPIRMPSHPIRYDKQVERNKLLFICTGALNSRDTILIRIAFALEARVPPHTDPARLRKSRFQRGSSWSRRTGGCTSRCIRPGWHLFYWIMPHLCWLPPAPPDSCPRLLRPL